MFEFSGPDILMMPNNEQAWSTLNIIHLKRQDIVYPILVDMLES